MCLAVPAKVLEIEENKGIVDFGGVRQKVRFDLVSNVKKGDYVLIHVGFAIEKLSKEEAEETLELLREIEEYAYRGD
ncbi:MAG: HypC/HybG/HupF family hydrogenase formation chaperone [Candidatus Methanofastidiosia archaeon]